jgi:hypothetical protein
MSETAGRLSWYSAREASSSLLRVLQPACRGDLQTGVKSKCARARQLCIDQSQTTVKYSFSPSSSLVLGLHYQAIHGADINLNVGQIITS